MKFKMADSLIDEKSIVPDLSQRAINRILSFGKGQVEKYLARHENRDIKSYSDYIIKKSPQESTIRNFIYDVSSVNLYAIYVQTRIRTGSDVVPGDNIIRALTETVNTVDSKTHWIGNRRLTRAIVVSGTAGMGKALFMKHAFIQIRESESARIPMLIELRSFNRLPNASIEDRIFEDIIAIGTRVIAEQIVIGLESGLFVILLDGMDELNVDKQAYYEAALLQFTKQFPRFPVLVSSRPM
jgi:hypothetical protein